MEDILESIRRIVSRWVNASTPLTSNASQGDYILYVENTTRFRVGDEVTVHNGSVGENPTINIAEIINVNSLRLERPLQFNWTVSSNSIVQKTYMNMFVQAIYIHEQNAIPRFPAIEIIPINEQSEWMTLGTTREKRNFEINIYVEQSTGEEGLRFLLRMAKTIRTGLKKNFYPLVGDYDVVNVTADVMAEDVFLRVADTSLMASNQLIVLEDKYQAEELRICNVIDSNTIQVFPLVHNDFLIDDSAKVIILHRFLFNSWPSDVQYGTVSKGSLVQGAKIQWFCEEQEVQTRGGWSDPNLS